MRAEMRSQKGFSITQERQALLKIK